MTTLTAVKVDSCPVTGEACSFHTAAGCIHPKKNDPNLFCKRKQAEDRRMADRVRETCEMRDSGAESFLGMED
jgi:hypothetical protein